MRKLRLGEGYMKKYRLEMELQLRYERRTVRINSSLKVRERRRRMQWRQKHVHSQGWKQSASGDKMGR